MDSCLKAVQNRPGFSRETTGSELSLWCSACPGAPPPPPHNGILVPCSNLEGVQMEEDCPGGEVRPAGCCPTALEASRGHLPSFRWGFLFLFLIVFVFNLATHCFWVWHGDHLMSLDQTQGNSATLQRPTLLPVGLSCSETKHNKVNNHKRPPPPPKARKLLESLSHV